MNNKDKINVVIVDLDGCIFDSRKLFKYIPSDKYSRDGWNVFNNHLSVAKPNYIIVNIVKELSKHYPIIFLTSREYAPVGDSLNTYKITCSELDKAFNGFAPIKEPHKLIMRKFDDYRDSDVVKEDLMIKHILPYYNVLLAIDDCEKNIEIFKKHGIDTIHYNINSQESNFLSLTKRIDLNA